MLLSGINHVAILTGDTDRLLEFYGGVFDATSEAIQNEQEFRVTLVWIGESAELNVFEIAGNAEHERQTPMFGRGRLDRRCLQCARVRRFRARPPSPGG